MGKISIAIDGPTPSGKDTVAKILAKQLNYAYCDTGAIYRTITYLVLQNQIDIQVEKLLVAPCANHTTSPQQTESGQHVFIDGHEATEAIRQPDVMNAVSAVSRHVKVRGEMVALQQRISQADRVVMDGRDIDTAVLPEAEVGIFLVAGVEERTEYHFKGNQRKGVEMDFRTLKAEIERRDYSDSAREVSFPVQASGAVKTDTTGLMIKEVVTATQSVVKQEDFELF